MAEGSQGWLWGNGDSWGLRGTAGGARGRVEAQRHLGGVWGAQGQLGAGGQLGVHGDGGGTGTSGRQLGGTGTAGGQGAHGVSQGLGGAQCQPGTRGMAENTREQLGTQGQLEGGHGDSWGAQGGLGAYGDSSVHPDEPSGWEAPS